MSNASSTAHGLAGFLLAVVLPSATSVAAEPAPPPRPVVRLKETPDEQAKAYKQLFERVGKSGLMGLCKDEDTSLALQAAWETHKKLIPGDPQGVRRRRGYPQHTYDPKEMNKFVAFCKERTRGPFPDWWADRLLDLAVSEGQFHLCWGADSKLGELTKIEFPTHVWFVRKGVDLALNGRGYTYKAGGMSIDITKPTGTCLADAPGKTVTCLATYTSIMSRRFDIAGFETKSGKRLWVSEVWALDRTVHAGPSSEHRVELVTRGSTIYVFGAALQGLYAEAFDLETGHCLFRFCTSYWGNYSEAWDLNPGN
jgi:hypothetical protein